MHEPEILKGKELDQVLKLAVEQKSTSVLSYMVSGKWHMLEVSFADLTETKLHVIAPPQDKPKQMSIRINQPVGISFHEEFNKYIFESLVIGFESSVKQTAAGRIVLDRPDRIERMQRRSSALCKIC